MENISITTAHFAQWHTVVDANHVSTQNTTRTFTVYNTPSKGFCNGISKNESSTAYDAFYMESKDKNGVATGLSGSMFSSQFKPKTWPRPLLTLLPGTKPPALGSPRQRQPSWKAPRPFQRTPEKKRREKIGFEYSLLDQKLVSKLFTY